MDQLPRFATYRLAIRNPAIEQYEWTAQIRFNIAHIENQCCSRYLGIVMEKYLFIDCKMGFNIGLGLT